MIEEEIHTSPFRIAPLFIGTTNFPKWLISETADKGIPNISRIFDSWESPMALSPHSPDSITNGTDGQ